MTPDLTDARLREIIAEAASGGHELWSYELIGNLASALIRTREERDAAVALLTEALAPTNFQRDRDGWLYCKLCDSFPVDGHAPSCLHTRIDSFLAQHSPATAPQQMEGGDATSRQESPPQAIPCPASYNDAPETTAPDATVSGAETEGGKDG